MERQTDTQRRSVVRNAVTFSLYLWLCCDVR